MDSQAFLDAFAHIANAPGGIAQLRSMIYQLAVTGALTPRLEGGLSAREVLRQINETRQSLIKAKRYKRMLELEAELVTPPQGIQIPGSWEWSRLLDLGEINPRNAADDDDRVAFLPMRGVPAEHRGTVEIEQGKWGDLKKGYTHFAVGDVVLAKITPCFENGKAAVIPQFQDGLTIGGGTTELLVFRPIHPAINTAYIYLFLRSPMFAVDGEARMTGTAGQKRLPTEYFATRAFPLPPVDEQAQIVAKVDELMTLCDRLEKQQEARRGLQIKARKALVQSAASASASRDLLSRWDKLADHFTDMISSPADINDFRGLILQMAVSGALCEADPNLTAIDAQISEAQFLKEQYARKNRLRKTTPHPPVDGPPYSVPCHWRWERLENLCLYIQRGKGPSYVKDSSYRVVSQKCIQWSGFDLSPARFISDESINKYGPERRLRFGDLLWNSTGTGTVGRIAIYDKNSEITSFADSHVTVIRLANFEPRFIWCVIAAPWIQARMDPRHPNPLVSGSTQQVELATTAVRALEIPCPPIDEQKRIVAKVDELMTFCDSLEYQLRHSERAATALAQAAVSAIIGIVAIEGEAELKAPLTELIAPLRIGTPPVGTAQAPLASILVRHSGSLSAKDLWQRFGGEIDSFYAQLKHEVAQGWIAEPEVAKMHERESA